MHVTGRQSDLGVRQVILDAVKREKSAETAQRTALLLAEHGVTGVARMVAMDGVDLDEVLPSRTQALPVIWVSCVDWSRTALNSPRRVGLPTSVGRPHPAHRGGREETDFGVWLHAAGKGDSL